MSLADTAGAAVADSAAGLALVKAAVKAQPPYVPDALAASRRLNLNESPYDLPADLKREVLARLGDVPWQRYPEFRPAALLERLAAHYGWDADGTLIGNGSNELIQASLTVTLDAGDVVVAPSPTFSVYRLMTSVLGGRYVAVPLGADFAYDADALVAAAVRERAKVVVLNSPNNPTGSVAPADLVERLLAATDALIICDEAYQEFGGPTWLPLVRRSSRVLVLRTFSKAMGMAGVRFGVGMAHPAVAREIAKGTLPYHVNQLTITAADVALAHPARFRAVVDELIRTRDRFVAGLRGLTGLAVFPTAANFVLVRSLAQPARRVFERLAAEHGILVRDFAGSTELGDCLRISIGTPADMDATLVALRAVTEG